MNVTTYKKTDLFLKCSDPRRAMTDRVWVFSRNTRAKIIFNISVTKNKHFREQSSTELSAVDNR